VCGGNIVLVDATVIVELFVETGTFSVKQYPVKTTSRMVLFRYNSRKNLAERLLMWTAVFTTRRYAVAMCPSAHTFFSGFQVD